jgi:hypothetical protein
LTAVSSWEGTPLPQWDYLLLKVDSNGTEEWRGTFGQPRGYDSSYIHDEAYGVRTTADGGFIICGGTGDEYSYSETGSPFGPSDIWQNYVVRTDEEGNMLWEGIYGSNSANDACEYMGLTSDGGYILTSDTDQGAGQWGLVKLYPDPATVQVEKSMLPVQPRIKTDKAWLIITLPSPGSFHLRVSDILGRTVYSGTITGAGIHRLDVFKREAVYIIELRGSTNRLLRTVFPVH